MCHAKLSQKERIKVISNYESSEKCTKKNKITGH